MEVKTTPLVEARLLQELCQEGGSQSLLRHLVDQSNRSDRNVDSLRDRSVAPRSRYRYQAKVNADSRDNQL